MPQSEEQRKAASERMKAMLAKKRADKAAVEEAIQTQAKALNEAVAQRDDDGTPLADPTSLSQPTVSQTEYADLLAQLAEMRSLLTSRQFQAPQEPQINARGKLTGTFEKHLVDPAYYPDPTERLAKEPRLARFAFPINYEMSWEVTVTQYETKDGVYTKEPKFTLELIKIVMDDETGEPTDGRYVLRTGVFFEDPQAALIVAREQSVDPDDFGGEKNFLDEMRYLRMRAWLIDAFYPARITGTKTNKKQTVINNRVVDFYTKNSLDSSSIDWAGGGNKLKG